MKKRYLVFVFAIACVLGMSAGVEAQAGSEFTVSVPFDFVAAGKTMPAGTYTVSRVLESGLSGLRLSSFDRKAAVLVLPTEFVRGPETAQVKLSFEEVGDKQFLKSIVTDSGAYKVSNNQQSAAVVARMRRQKVVAAGGSR